MAIRKGFKPQGGYSKAVLEKLTPEDRAKFDDEGMYLNGAAPDELPDYLKEEYGEVEAPKEEMIPLSQIDALIQQRLDAAMANLPKATPKTDSGTTKTTNVDDIPECRGLEFKDRIYVLMDGSKPVTWEIRNRHKKGNPLQYFNDETKSQHALRYSSNQVSLFVDKQVGDVIVTHIIGKGGMLNVPKENVNLQKLLHIHPDRNKVWRELDPTAEARKEAQSQDLKIDAHILSREISYANLEAIARLMCVGFNDDWTSDIVKKEMYNEIEKNPQKFINLANDDKLVIKGVIRTAVHRGIITFKNYRFLNEKGELILEVDRNKDEYDEFANWADTHEGRKTYKWIETQVL